MYVVESLKCKLFHLSIEKIKLDKRDGERKRTRLINLIETVPPSTFYKR